MRVAAVAIDALVLFFVAGVLIIAGSVNLLLSSDFDRVDASGGSINLFWALVGAVPAACFLYFFLGFAFWGKTAGAAIMRISVVRSDGGPLGLLGALARVTGMLSYVLVLGIGAVLAYVLRGTPAAAAALVGVQPAHLRRRPPLGRLRSLPPRPPRPHRRDHRRAGRVG